MNKEQGTSNFEVLPRHGKCHTNQIRLLFIYSIRV